MTRKSQNGERSGDTRQRLLDAAIDVFGRLGYDGAATRAIADAAGVNLAAIPYHFGGKEGLYLAVAEHIAGVLEARLIPEIANVGGDPRRRLRMLVDRLTDSLVRDAEAERWARFIVREQMTPTKAFDILYDRVMSPVLGFVTSCFGQALDDETARLRALTALGQILVFRAARAAALRHMDWQGVGQRELEAIRAMIWTNLSAMLPDPDNEGPQ